MELLVSNIPPVRFPKRNTIACFEDLIQDADGIRIASGYVSADALAELKKIIEDNKKSFLEIVIGMHGRSLTPRNILMSICAGIEAENLTFV